MSWGGVITLTCIFIACVALTGCVQHRPDGWCALSVNGACMSRWHSGETKASGDVDMQYMGTMCSFSGEGPAQCTGVVNTQVRDWDFPDDDTSVSNVPIM